MLEIFIWSEITWNKVYKIDLEYYNLFFNA